MASAAPNNRDLDPLFDRELAKVELNCDDDFIDEIALMFADDLTPALRAIIAGMGSERWDDVVHQTHILRNSASALGITPLVSLLETLEMMCNERPVPDQVKGQVKAVRDACLQLNRELKASMRTATAEPAKPPATATAKSTGAENPT